MYLGDSDFEVRAVDTSQPALSSDSGKPSPAPFRGLLGNAARFWEPRRVLYNLILGAVTLFWVVRTWPHFRPALSLATLLPLSVLALIANVCYSAAYFVDLPLEYASPTASRKQFRWGLWLLGTLLAMVLTSYWILDEIYPDFH